MAVLRIEHPVPDFAAWKAAFDSDPVGRERGGVTGYRVLRPIDDPNYVLIDLDFDTADDAEAFFTLLRGLWQRVEGEVMREPRARMLDVVEDKVY